MFAKTVFQAMHCREAWRPLRGQVRSYARWAESKRPPARGVGANVFAKTVVQAMHVRKAWRPLRGQVRSYARWAESKTAFCPRGRSELVREDGLSSDALSGSLTAPSRTSPLLRPLGRIKNAFCLRGRSERVREDARSGDTFLETLTAPSRTSPLLRPLGRIKNSRRRSLRRYIFGNLNGPFADKSAPTPVGQNQKRPSARGVGANLFAKTVVQAMHVRKAWRPLRGQVRSYARWAESKRPPARGVGDSMVLGKPSSHFCLIFALVL